MACGAAIQAAVLTNAFKGTQLDRVEISDVTPLSLGVGVYGGGVSTMIKRNTAIPTSYECGFCTVEDNQTAICVRLV